MNALVSVDHLEKQTFVVTSCDVEELILFLDDDMCDMDKEIQVHWKETGHVLFKGVVPRTARAILRTTDERGDPGMVFDAMIRLQIPK